MSIKISNVQRTNKRESGMVSILVTMFMMIIITLIVIGFAKIIQREQSQSLDNQLSTQAFYAAESGVNDAVKAMKSPSFDFTKNYTICNDPGIMSLLPPNADQINSSLGVSYTCLLVNPMPTSLPYTVGTSKSTVVPIRATNSTTITSINLNWQSTDTNQAFTSCPAKGKFDISTSWPSTACSAGVMRIDVVPTDDTLTRAGLMNSALTVFLYPQSSGGTNTYAYNAATNTGVKSGEVVGVSCSTSSTPTGCNLSITGLSGTSYYLRARSIYTQNYLTVSANGGNVPLSGAQAVVDSTGKANDVLRRISERVDLSNAGDGAPSFAIISRDSICKRFSTIPGYDPTIQSADSACQLN